MGRGRSAAENDMPTTTNTAIVRGSDETAPAIDRLAARIYDAVARCVPSWRIEPDITQARDAEDGLDAIELTLCALGLDSDAALAIRIACEEFTDGLVDLPAIVAQYRDELEDETRERKNAEQALAVERLAVAALRSRLRARGISEDGQ